MLEVKVRGYSKGYNKWIYGWGVAHIKLAEKLSKETGVSYVSQIYNDTGNYEVVTTSVGEFAFKLKLLEGEKELYEGDVIENIVGKKYVIEWDADYGTFFFVELDGKSEGTVAFEFIENCEHENCYLFGNITENPELLEVAE